MTKQQLLEDFSTDGPIYLDNHEEYSGHLRDNRAAGVPGFVWLVSGEIKMQVHVEEIDVNKTIIARMH